MAEKKQLVVALEGTAALGRYWRTIFSDYLQKLIRSFCGDGEANSNVHLALVQFNVHGVLSSCLIQRSAWVRNVDYYLELLEAMDCRGGGFCDAAITEGLAEVLMMYPPPNGGQTQQNSGFGRHCILVAASEPYPIPTIVYRPPDENETQSQRCLSDAETLGKRNPLADDHTIDIVTNSHYLVLISDDFVAACADLSQSGITILPSNHQGSDTQAASVSGSPSTSGSHVAQNTTTHGSLTSTISNISLSSSPAMPQPLDLQGELQEPQFAQSGASTNQNKMKGVALSDTHATGTIMPAASALQSSESGYVKLWETYRKSTASALLAEDWPSTLHIYKCIPQEKLKKQKYVEREADRLAFVAMNQHAILEKLKKKNVCAVIHLPSQKLVLSISDAGSTWVGTLYPNRVVVREPQTSGQQTPESQGQLAAATSMDHDHDASQQQQPPPKS
ncbi:hypothetical protein SSX86_016011 [Deinandra increscens subsp. villosa]|uniref:Mediator of RNA polymerase II transcription subunit 25 n=1 Tax=Deinandra increscens subsp. villosa TaxID=3103831 RepID=A0AAP0D4G5_9ASTR